VIKEKFLLPTGEKDSGGQLVSGLQVRNRTKCVDTVKSDPPPLN
jgi:hypothetical protein